MTTATILRGNALALPLEDDTVDLIVTSPPYFGLRSYQDGGEHYSGQIGDEATPAEFVDALIAATAEMVRVLKPSGSIWVNLGDKYSGAQQQNSGRQSTMTSAEYWARTNPKTTGVRAKSLYGIPWRYAIRCIDDLGLILRAEVIWSKPNGLPESVTDRVRRSHETWFHFTKEPRYYSAVDEIREAHVGGSTGLAATFGRPKPSHDLVPGQGYTQHRADRPQTPAANPLGKLPGSVWTIPTQPLTVPDWLGVDHFAAFPMEWPRRIIRGWSPEHVCTACGEGRRPVTSSVACPDTTAPTTPGVILDPFGGTGTTALVATALGRHGISVDMSADYCRLARWRTTDPKQLARAAREPFTASQTPMDGQGDLLTFAAWADQELA